MKSKPAQQSVKLLNSMGIQPDFIIGRAEVEMDDKRKERLALFCNVQQENVISNPDVKSIYEIPIILDKQKLAEKIIDHLKLKPKKNDLSKWKKLVKTIKTVTKPVKIALVGKYFQTGSFTLSDSYISVIEALKHGAWANNLKPEFSWINSEDFEKNYKKTEILKEFDGVVIPQGWGSRGVEGKINAIRYLRENKIPYLGLCFGMQMAVIEFARNVCGLKNANSEEVNSKTKYPIVHIMPNQKEYLEKYQYGGTIRLGSYPCKLAKNSIIKNIYKKDLIHERHRHRYEFNDKYKNMLKSKGLVLSGTSPDGKLVEVIELPKSAHPFFVGTQFHPEYKSRPLSPHPIFVEFIRSCIK